MTDTPDNQDTAPEAAEGTVIPPDHQQGEWLPPAGAAARLGVSERTLWRHVNAGRYHKRTVGGRAEILVPGERDGAPDSSASTNTPAVRMVPDTLTLAVIDELRQQRQDDRQRLTRLEDEREALLQRAAAAEALAEERQQELARERQETARLRARRWYDPRTW